MLWVEPGILTLCGICPYSSCRAYSAYPVVSAFPVFLNVMVIATQPCLSNLFFFIFILIRTFVNRTWYSYFMWDLSL